MRYSSVQYYRWDVLDVYGGFFFCGFGCSECRARRMCLCDVGCALWSVVGIVESLCYKGGAEMSNVLDSTAGNKGTQVNLVVLYLL